MARLKNTIIDVVRLAAMDMKDSMVRMDKITAMPAIEADKLKAAGLLVWLIYQANREVFTELLALTHEDTEGMFAICRFQGHIVPLHFAVQPHLPPWRADDLLRAGNKGVQFVICKRSHFLDRPLNKYATKPAPWR